MLGSACATKSFVEKQVSAAERQLTLQIAATEATLTDRAGETRRAIDVADQRLNGLDLRVGEVSARVSNAEARADLAGRNRHRVMDTKSVYFDSGQIEIRRQDLDEVEAVAKALAADPNTILELQGFADPRGSDRYNRDLARERVEAVMRHLVRRHGIELRQLRALAMGEVAPGAGEKASPEVLATARRVDLRLLAPSSWEHAQGQTAPEPAATVVPPPRGPATISALPGQAEPMPPEPAARIDAPGRERLPEFLKTITPQDLGG